MHDVQETFEAVKRWCEEHKLPADHGWEHFSAVFHHALRAVSASMQSLTTEQTKAVLLASLLHDVDDPKISKFVPVGSNATNFLRGYEAHVQKDVLELIGLVSATKNGEDQKGAVEEWKLIPRACDRLEAIGYVGVQRCYDVTVRLGNPLCTAQTALPLTLKDMNSRLEGKTLQQYMDKGGRSESMVDHFWDKLLLLQCPVPSNPYLEQQWCERMQFMQHWILRFSQTLHLLQRPVYGRPGVRVLDI